MSDGYRVLVVDDDPNNLLIASMLLGGQGYTIQTATTGLQCLAAVHEEPPDLILLDVKMPEMDGFEACRRLKADEEFRHIPVVLLTALGSSEHRVVGFEAGADDFITKPFNKHELLVRVRSLIRIKRLEEQSRQHIRQMLERYVDSTVARQILHNPDLAVPHGRRANVSVLFADVRGFTAWAERSTAEGVVEVMNLLLAQATEAVFRHNGMVDKFTGDGLMAVFGAPAPLADHPRRCVAAALEIAEAAANMRHEQLTTPLHVGCGINSGEMIVGNIGSERRLDYTVMGDGVNVARRLTEKARPDEVLVSESTFLQLGPAEAVDLGWKRARNRNGLVRIYAIRRLL